MMDWQWSDSWTDKWIDNLIRSCWLNGRVLKTFSYCSSETRLFLFKERQPSSRYSQKQPSRSVLWSHQWGSGSQETISNIYIYIYIYPNDLFLQKFLKFQIFESSFFNTFRRWLLYNKNPWRSSRPKEFLEVAVLKYLRKLPGNYPSKVFIGC